MNKFKLIVEVEYSDKATGKNIYEGFFTVKAITFSIAVSKVYDWIICNYGNALLSYRINELSEYPKVNL